MRNNIFLLLGALLFMLGASSCEKYESDSFDRDRNRTANYITIPAARQAARLRVKQGDTINRGRTPILSARLSFPDTLTATLVLDAAAAGIDDITYTRTLAPQLNSWAPVFPIPANYLPAGVDSTAATLKLTSVNGPISGSLKLGYLPGDVVTIPLLIYR